MRLCRFAAAGRERLGLAIDGILIDLLAGSGLVEGKRRELAGIGDSMRAFLAAGDDAMSMASAVQRIVTGMLAERRSLVHEGQPVVYSSDVVRLLPPIADPDKFLLLGLNYRDHVEETSQPMPTVPVVFAKFRNAIIGPREDIVLPKAAPTRVDYEAELAFVVGRRARRVPLDHAYEYIAGYCAVNDVTARNLQKSHSQWLIGKSVDTFAPLGPYIVTRDEVPDPHDLAIRCLVNGEERQNSSTAHLIFDVPFLLHQISQTMTLEAGDVISTGTPAGVGYARRPPVYLQPGDTVRVEIEGIGVLDNPVVMEE